jgi:hypothetical protein
MRDKKFGMFTQLAILAVGTLIGLAVWSRD